jgi:hypothetical protein
MISVSASLFQSYFRTEREPSINVQLRDGGDNGSEKLAQNTLRQSLEDHLGLELPAEQTVKGPMFDVDAVMDTVLKHVEGRIDQARADGATDEELEDMLAAARSGVETGFSQARGQIEELGKLDDALAEKIDSAESGIYQGIDDFEESLFSDAADGETAPVLSSLTQYEQSYQREKNNFSFELTTQEGDKVVINAMSDSEMYEQSYSSANENGSLSMYSASEQSRSGYSFSVEGDLNEAEMTAIEDLLGQVNSLADEFYDGDLGTAFDMALELESDGDQIAQFSLNLRQQQVQSYQYSGVAQYTGEASIPQGLMQPLGQFAQGLQGAADTAQEFQHPQELLKSLFEQMDSNPKFHEMLQPMFDSLAA